MFKRADGRWQEAVTINGKRKYFYGKTRAEIIRKIQNWKSEETHGRLFSEVARDWDAEHETSSTYQGHIAYNKAYNRALEEFGNRRIKDITAQDIAAYINELALMQYARRTVQMHLSLLSLVFDHAILHGELEQNPARIVKLPKSLKTSKRQLPSESDLQHIKENVDKPFGLFAFLLMYTGLRRGEALALTYEDIDRENMLINVSKSLYWEVNQPVIKDVKTEAGERSVVLLDALAEHLPDGAGYIFGGVKPLTQTVYRRRWNHYRETANISCTPHQLRHYYATLCYEAGIDEKLAQELLGHSSITVTRDIYTHIRHSKLQTAAELLNSAVHQNPKY